MSDSALAITNLIYTYAQLLDSGDLDGVARLFEHGRICGVEDGPPETVFAGVARVRQMYEMATRIYEDGTPKTRHNTSNVQLYIDDAAGTASSTSYYCVTQATPDLPLQVIVTGHYKDTFQRLDGVWWFESRTMFVDQIGDVSQHLKF
ncbi:nuclear transport factor 2 family protein [Mycobacterium sp. TY814]|uniref:nuclear transport factor 2 family protein n=1 Tax=unclassified Mycobacterium TaxID=2642494 RepID=UPI000FC24861|nr:nuclear transport factor 2 family protein [Mycobacterium sp. TY814]MDP7721457.1 nuclear transport factor 2 family protein [Mycobacterium sp. TY814]RUP03425.1 MAG: nuclear transport factor 2 family protein [Mycobacterium sp.]